MKRVISLLLPLALLAAACGGDDDAGGDEGPSSDWCTLGAEIRDSGDALDGVDFMNADSLRTTLEELRSVLDRAQGVAPDEIRDDVATSRQAFDDFYGILEDADFNFLDVDLEALESFGDDAESAGDRIDEYNRRVCGFEDDDAGDSTTSTVAGSDDTVDEESTGDDSAPAASLPGGGDVRSQLIAQMMSEFVAQGFTEDEARCIAESFDLEGMMSGEVDPTDPASVMDPFEECGIGLDRLAEIGGG